MYDPNGVLELMHDAFKHDEITKLRAGLQRVANRKGYLVGDLNGRLVIAKKGRPRIEIAINASPDLLRATMLTL